MAVSISQQKNDLKKDVDQTRRFLANSHRRRSTYELLIPNEDGNTFCTTLYPRLFTIDLKIMEHKVFFTELLSLCEADDVSLQKLPCYKSINNLVPLRKSALRALAACHYIPECREKIFQVLFKVRKFYV